MVDARSSLDNDPTIIKKYNGSVGLAYWSLETNSFIVDANGQPIRAGEKITRCPHCGAVKRVK